MKSLTLNNGIKIDCIGYGTYLIDNDNAYECVLNAFKLGYRHIDSAQDYGNEEAIGKAIRDAGIKRSEIFLTTKVAAHLKTYEDAKRSIQESLNRLNINYIDLLLIHCPTPWEDFENRTKTYFKENLEVWKAMVEFYKAGKVKAIGVSNFNIDDIKNINDNSSVKVMVNQISVSIGNYPKNIIDYCKDNNIVVEAYCPNIHGRAFKNDFIIDMAKKCNTNVATLCIAYTLQLGLVSLPKSTSISHMEENIKALDFVISEEDMKILNNR